MTHIAPHTRANAKRLRAEATPQERLVWAGLRDLNRAFGAHFALTHASWLVAYPLVGYLASRIGAGPAFTFCGAACLLILMSAWFVGRGQEHAHAH